jgi:hypothetical protein
LISFAGVPALWNAEPIPPGSAAKEKYLPLGVLCVFNEQSEWAVKKIIV